MARRSASTSAAIFLSAVDMALDIEIRSSIISRSVAPGPASPRSRRCIVEFLSAA